MFSTNLKNLIIKNKVTQKELAEFVGVKQNTVSDWINRGTSPKIEQIYRIIDFFSISFDELFFDSKTNISKIQTENNSTYMSFDNNFNNQITVDEHNLLQTYREIDDVGKNQVQNCLKEIWAEHRVPKNKLSDSPTENVGDTIA